MLLPVQAAELVPVPVLKPYSVGSETVPIPSIKPKSLIVSLNDNVQTTTFKSMSLSVAKLFSTEKEYTNNYKPLSAGQSKIYAATFKAQALGEVNQADDLIAKISDKRLVGHVLYQRYMSASYKPSGKELRGWMSKYSDYPNAEKIYKLALSRKTSGDVSIVKPKTSKVLSQVNEPTIYYPKRHVSKINRTALESKAIIKLSRRVKVLVGRGKASEALEFFKVASTRQYMDKVERDITQVKIASGFLYSGRLDAAYKLAAQSADRSGVFVPDASWIAGLALWQKGDFATASTYFEQAGKSSYASGWLRSAGYYWAARCYKRTGNKSKLRDSLELAAKNSHTFYGLLAVQSLGKKPKFNWDVPEYKQSHETVILSSEAGKRAFALVAAGQYDLAESELIRLPYKKNKELRRSVLAYAAHVGLPSLSLRLGNMLQRKDGKYYNSAIYPVSPWAPQGGYKIDPALVHAVIRQESRFNQSAKSYSGARGLMQIMPKTAQYVAKIRNYSEKLSVEKLGLPETNMKVGQDYLEYLLKGRYVKGDVVSLLVAYNAGPGNLLKWRDRLSDKKDQLLFIETLPVQETRDYVERVLSNYWIYRSRAGLDQPSLLALSRGAAPKYTHVMQSTYPYKLAANQ